MDQEMFLTIICGIVAITCIALLIMVARMLIELKLISATMVQVLQHLSIIALYTVDDPKDLPESSQFMLRELQNPPVGG